VKVFRTLPAADYVQGQSDVSLLAKQFYYPDKPYSGNPNDHIPTVKITPFSWQRRLLFAKAQADADPQYLLVRDDFLGACPPPTASFWIMAKDLKFTGNQVHATGQLGVDLELYSVLPTKATYGQWSFEHQNWGGEKQLCVRVTEQESKPFLTLLYPRRPEEPMPVFTALAEGNGVKITTPDIAGSPIDYAFLAVDVVNYHDEQVTFAAPSGYVRLTGNHARLVLNAGGSAGAQGITLTATQAVSLEIGPDSLLLKTDGEQQKISLRGKLPPTPGVTIDGKRALVTVQNGELLIPVSAGAHSISVQ
jgi:hypothetical protein